ncbi:hypothetical protein JIR23_17090 [Bradyrhizobium diazoefficiens]|nr:hypothetical protein [Bradyrhizobium diazoefficiens]QQN61381.1 hypothetical protein JIR23_17090 [Bradyrhizobium diazoefficiens]
MQPIAAYDTGKDAEGKPNGGRMPWPPELVAIYAHQFFQGMRMISAYQDIAGTAIVSMTDTVRTRILQLTLELKEEAASAPAADRGLASGKIDQSVINHIYGGNVVIAANAENFAQIGSITVEEGRHDQLRKALEQLGLDKKAIGSLKKEMDADAAEAGGKPTLGQRTKNWLSDTASYVSKEGLKVGIDVAKRTATKWILQHYGFNVG